MDINTNNVITMPKHQIQVERIRVLYKQVPSLLLSNLLIASLLTFFLYEITANILSLYWMIVVILVSSFRFIMLKQYENQERDEKDIIWWGWFFVLTAFISGCTWGATSILFLQTDNIVIMLFLLMTLTGVTVGSSASLSNFAWSYYAFAIPTVLPFAYVLSSTEKSDFIVLSVMLSVFLLLQLVVAKKNQNTLDESIILRNEKTNLIEQLELKKEKAEVANSAKTQFLAAASHDLRQPLHAMGLFIDILTTCSNVSERNKIITKIKKSSSALEDLLESLLDISKLDAGIISENKHPFPLQKMFDILATEFEPIANDKNLSVKFVNTHIWVNSDQKLIDQILRNFISNAIRYTDKGKVLVGCRRKGNDVLLSVYDSGNGFTEDKYDLIFTEFQQLDNPERDRSKGLGLGLAIVERTSHLIDADINVKSTLNKGSVFSIKVPTCSALKESKLANNNLSTFNDFSEKYIVVVDDEEDIRDGLTLLLKSWGCHVCAISSLDEAKSELHNKEKCPDLILADYRLRDNETGVDVINEIKSIFPDNKIPAVIITGDTAPDRIKEAKESGYTLLHKPVSGGRLRATLNAELLAK